MCVCECVGLCFVWLKCSGRMFVCRLTSIVDMYTWIYFYWMCLWHQYYLNQMCRMERKLIHSDGISKACKSWMIVGKIIIKWKLSRHALKNGINDITKKLNFGKLIYPYRWHCLKSCSQTVFFVLYIFWVFFFFFFLSFPPSRLSFANVSLNAVPSGTYWMLTYFRIVTQAHILYMH